jgi:CO/xanthine dehydrogenase FAD-binding subunit
MIPFDFEYYRPTGIDEAVQLFKKLDSENKSPVYYGGGTEIICMSRVNHMWTKAVIDIKEIAECNVLEVRDNKIIIGAAVTLTKICESNIFPLLSRILRSSADHTSRNKITMGGNICSKIPYREGVLPFLICDSVVEVAGLNGRRVLDINDLFNERLKLEKGDILIRIVTEKEYVDLPFEAVKRTKQERVDYPLISIAAVMKNNQIRTAFSGVCAYPFRSKEIEAGLNNEALGDKKMDMFMSLIPGSILSDIQGSAEYREFVLRNTLCDILERMGVK